MGELLRSVRVQQGLTLNDVETKSQGRLKAVVVSSYERANRAITMARLTELAEFYGVPPAHLLPAGGSACPSVRGANLVLDLQRLVELPTQLAGPLARYAAVVRAQRGDVTDKAFNIQSEDVHSLAVLYNLPTQTLKDHLVEWGVLSTAGEITSPAPSETPPGKPPQRAAGSTDSSRNRILTMDDSSHHPVSHKRIGQPAIPLTPTGGRTPTGTKLLKEYQPQMKLRRRRRPTDPRVEERLKRPEETPGHLDLRRDSLNKSYE